MDFSFAQIKRGWLLAALASAVVFSAQAQYPESRQGQPIIFSSPQNDDVGSNMPSLSPKPPGALSLEDTVQAPAKFSFNGPPTIGPLPAVVPTISLAEVAQRQDMLDRRNNWLLLTPAEILGLATPEKILGISERDAFGQPKNSTAMERYTERQNLLLAPRTNAFQTDRSSPAWDFLSDRRSASNTFNSSWRNPENAVNPLFPSGSDRDILGRRNEDRSWAKLFSQPAPTPTPTPTPAQLADMERFRQLLNPGMSTAEPAANPESGGIKTSLPQTLLVSGLGQPPPSRIGAVFTPLNSGIGKAADLPKLPSVWGLSYTSSPAAWGPQQAPWLSPGPQPFIAPQRKF